MTTLYLMRHSKPLKNGLEIDKSDAKFLLKNKKTPLSVEGEELAAKISKNQEFDNLDVVFSSDYIRAISTAIYFAYRRGFTLNALYELGERIHGIDSWEQLPPDFEIKQFEDENYKIGYGESQKEVRERMFKIINIILNEYKNKNILVVGHSTAIMFLLKTWCEVNYGKEYKFKNQVFFDGKWNYCETFKLEFDDNNNLINIVNLKF